MKTFALFVDCMRRAKEDITSYFWVDVLISSNIGW
jgi:hypothetical protein